MAVLLSVESSPRLLRLSLWYYSIREIKALHCGCMGYNAVPEYGKVQDGQRGINALPPKLYLEGRQIAQQSS